MNFINKEDFFEKYIPIENTQFPNKDIVNDVDINKMGLKCILFMPSEYKYIAEYMQDKRFWTVEKAMKDGEYFGVSIFPGLYSTTNTIGYIITKNQVDYCGPGDVVLIQEWVT